MKRSIDRILTTHAGSLPRPEGLQSLLQARQIGEDFDQEDLRESVSSSVDEVVRIQSQVGIDIVSDGEQSKSNFFAYVQERLLGIEPAGEVPPMNSSPDFPGFQDWWAGHHRIAGSALLRRPECVGPLAWKNKEQLDSDIENLKHALSTVQVEEAFLPAASVGIIAQRIPNRYYTTYEQYVEAIANVMKEEYQAIARADLVVQIDAPEMCIDRNHPPFRDKPIVEFRKQMELWVEALNYALTGINEEQVRFHICWGNGERPHTEDVPLEEIIDVIFKVHAGAYSVEAANPRHAHEWKLWEKLKLPDGKVLIPGVIDSTTNFVEHPELVAQRVICYANLLGRENVIAGTDCGFGTTAFANSIFPPVAWAKLGALVEGSRLASESLWPQ